MMFMRPCTNLSGATFGLKSNFNWSGSKQPTTCQLHHLYRINAKFSNALFSFSLYEQANMRDERCMRMPSHAALVALSVLPIKVLERLVQGLHARRAKGIRVKIKYAR
jgi:hypothetical protein